MWAVYIGLTIAFELGSDAEHHHHHHHHRSGKDPILRLHARHAQAAEPAELAAEPVKVAEPAEVAEHAKVAETAKVAEPAKVAETVPEPIKVESVKVAEPVKAAEPSKVTEPAKIAPLSRHLQRILDHEMKHTDIEAVVKATPHEMKVVKKEAEKVETVETPAAAPIVEGEVKHTLLGKKAKQIAEDKIETDTMVTAELPMQPMGKSEEKKETSAPKEEEKTKNVDRAHFMSRHLRDLIDRESKERHVEPAPAKAESTESTESTEPSTAAVDAESKAEMDAAIDAAESDVVKESELMRTSDERNDRDYVLEAKPLMAVDQVLAKFPLLAHSPVWNLINPTVLASDPHVIDKKFRELEPVMSPQGKQLAAAFPHLSMRDLPVFEWMKTGVTGKEWRDSADESLPEFRDAFPALLGTTSLQDLSLEDLKAIGEQKRSLWATNSQHTQMNTTVETEAPAPEQIEGMRNELAESADDRKEAIMAQRDAAKELKEVKLEHELLREKFEKDQALIADQQVMLSKEAKVMSGIDLKLTALEATRLEQRKMLTSEQGLIRNMTVEVSTMRRMVREKNQALFEKQTENRILNQHVELLEGQLKAQGVVEDQLHLTQKEDNKLRKELNVTLTDEAAESKANQALNAEVSTFNAETQRLTHETLDETA